MKQFFQVLLALSLGASATAFAGKKSAVEGKYPYDEGVYAVSGKAQKEAISSKLEEVDVPFEMGDGYYDVVWSKLYIVRDGSDVIGYIEKYKLSYTEDREYVYVLVRWDAKGKRVGEIESIDSEPQ